MRVAILGPFNVIGGVSTVSEEMALAFLRRGDDITVVTLDHSKKPCLSPNPISIYLQNEKFKLVPLKSLLNIYAFIKLLNSEHYDLVISNLYYSILLSITNAKKIHILHGMGHYYPTLNDWFRAKVGNYSNILGAKFADKVIANSYLTAAINNSMFGINSTVVPLGVSPPASKPYFDEDSRDIDLLYVGRLVPFKMITTALEALALLSKNYNHPINFHIVGNGSEENNLKVLAKHLGIENKVVFHGYVPREKISEFYNRSRCLISLNPTEPFGLTYLEALVYGTPVILCRGSGFSSFCDERFACLVDCEPKSVAEGIIKTLTNMWQREWIATYILQKFSWDKMVESMLDTTNEAKEIFV